MDFGTLPPEINSGRMYAGAGPGPMLAAAAAWDGLAAELHNMAAAYHLSVSELAGEWQGPSSAAMAAAAAPYAAWMNATAAQAEQTAAQGRAAAAAYEAAFAATVPPPVIAANRSLLMTLIATNILGQNTLAIAATEAHYAEMWAQDAAAMYCYAGSSALAAQLTPFSEPPRTANPAAATGQSDALAGAAGSNVLTQLSDVITQAPTALQNLVTAITPASVAAEINSGLESFSTFMGNLTGPYSPIGWIGLPGGWWLTAMQLLGTAQNVPGVNSLLAGPVPITGALGPLSGGYVSFHAPMPAGPGGGSVSAGLGRASLVGSLSVPSNWVSAAPALKTFTSVLPGSTLTAASAMAMESPAGLLGSQMALSSLAGRAMGAGAAPSIGAATRAIGARAGWAGTETFEDSGNEVTIIVIPPSEQ